jgi:hypothetical protein
VLEEMFIIIHPVYYLSVMCPRVILNTTFKKSSQFLIISHIIYLENSCSPPQENQQFTQQFTISVMFTLVATLLN